MSHPSFRPSRRAAITIAALGAVSLGLAAYLRYQLVEPATVGLVCDAGAMTPVCIIRRVFIGVFVWNGFGGAALVAAVLALVRPSNILIGAAVIAGFLGVVLYNTQLSALALALLPLVFARPAPAKEFLPE